MSSSAELERLRDIVRTRGITLLAIDGTYPDPETGTDKQIRPKVFSPDQIQSRDFSIPKGTKAVVRITGNLPDDRLARLNDLINELNEIRNEDGLGDLPLGVKPVEVDVALAGAYVLEVWIGIVRPRQVL